MNIIADSLIQALGTKDKAVFGIAYSIITWGGVAKGASISTSGVTKTLGKLVEDGHATTFMSDTENITMSGIGNDGWVFYGGKLSEAIWARTTDNATTDVYYTTISADEVKKYHTIIAKLETGPQPVYSETWPNLPCSKRYENCISSSHMIVHLMGYSSVASTKGIWIPSAANWATWAATCLSSWKHMRFPTTNTHIP